MVLKVKKILLNFKFFKCTFIKLLFEDSNFYCSTSGQLHKFILYFKKVKYFTAPAASMRLKIYLSMHDKVIMFVHGYYLNIWIKKYRKRNKYCLTKLFTQLLQNETFLRIGIVEINVDELTRSIYLSLNLIKLW